MMLLSLEMFERVVYGGIVGICVIFGILCNLACLFIFSMDRRRPQINLYLSAIAGWDAFLLFNSFFLYSIPSLFYDGIFNCRSYAFSIPYWYMSSHISLVGSVWATVALAMSQYWSICHPFWHRRVMSPWLVKVGLTLLSLTAFIFCLPRFFEIEVDWQQNWPENSTDTMVNQTLSINQSSSHLLVTENRNLTVISDDTDDFDPYATVIYPSPAASGFWYKTGYKLFCFIIFRTCLPFFWLIVLMGRITWASQKGMNRRRQLKTGRFRRASWVKFRKPKIPTHGIESPVEEEVKEPKSDVKKSILDSPTIQLTLRHITFLPSTISNSRLMRKLPASVSDMRPPNVMLVILKFMVAHILPTILAVLELRVPHYNESAIIFVLVILSNLLVILNSSTNIFIYYCWSPRFRTQLQALIGCKGRPNLVVNRDFSTSGQNYDSIHRSEVGNLTPSPRWRRKYFLRSMTSAYETPV